MISFKQFFMEKLIVGLEEIITLEGIGPIKAKLDSGNGAFNVLHGEDIETDGNIVRFTTEGGISVEKDIQDTITINLGAGNKEERPVVLFNVKIGNKVFKDIPFSIGNRSENAHKVLIGKIFILDSLDALIDVGLNNVAEKGIEVDV
jgi:hypothetical protein